ncbi:MAG: 23S rRNA (uracil(1939)-C(5))-methyltransferase, partial [Proteobacteria bacterium]
MTLLEGRVDDLSHDGRGVVRVDGKVFFVEGALPGEWVSFVRQKRSRKHEIGRLEQIVERSPDRVEPPCEYFGTCGGCAIQHLSSEGQVAFKQNTLLENLERIGGVRPEVLLEPVVGPISGYRRKARLGIRHVPKKGGVLVGFRERHKSYITSLDHCLALHPDVSGLLRPLHELVSKLSCHTRLPQIEVACGDAHIALVFRHLEPLNDEDNGWLKRFADDHNVDIYLQSGGLDTVIPLNPGSERTLSYCLPEYDVSIAFQPTDFVQVNGDVNRMMVNRAIELVEPGADDVILELFCGIGNFSLPLARHAGRVIAAEANVEMVSRATA